MNKWAIFLENNILGGLSSRSSEMTSNGHSVVLTYVETSTQHVLILTIHECISNFGHSHSAHFDYDY